MSDHRYDDDLDLTAAEYVLGTLEADAVSAFQQRLIDDAGARAALSAWERRLGRLGTDLEPVEPPATAWQTVCERTGIAARPGHTVTPAPGHETTESAGAPGRQGASRGDRRARRRSPRPAVERWRGLALAASAAAVVLAAVLFTGLPGGEPAAGARPVYVSMLYDQPTGTSWLVTAKSRASETLSVEALRDYQVPDGKTLRLWIASDDGKPRYVGTFPHHVGEHSIHMPAAARQDLGHADRFMVTMENASAPVGKPNGPVMWESPIGQRTG